MFKKDIYKNENAMVKVGDTILFEDQKHRVFLEKDSILTINSVETGILLLRRTLEEKDSVVQTLRKRLPRLLTVNPIRKVLGL